MGQTPGWAHGVWETLGLAGALLPTLIQSACAGLVTEWSVQEVYQGAATGPMPWGRARGRAALRSGVLWACCCSAAQGESGA